jgi:hypothetical protein
MDTYTELWRWVYVLAKDGVDSAQALVTASV